jgi:hypothetical protein
MFLLLFLFLKLGQGRSNHKIFIVFFIVFFKETGCVCAAAAGGAAARHL